MEGTSVQFNPLIAKLQGYLESNKISERPIDSVKLARYVCELLSTAGTYAEASSNQAPPFHQQVSDLLSVMLINCQDLTQLPSAQLDCDKPDAGVSKCGAVSLQQRESCRAMLPLSLALPDIVACLSCCQFSQCLRECLIDGNFEYYSQLVACLTDSFCDIIMVSSGFDPEIWHSLSTVLDLCCLAADKEFTRPLTRLVESITCISRSTDYITNKSVDDTSGNSTKDKFGNTGQYFDDLGGHQLAAFIQALAYLSKQYQVPSINSTNTECVIDSTEFEGIIDNITNKCVSKTYLFRQLFVWLVQKASQLLRSADSEAVDYWRQLPVSGCFSIISSSSDQSLTVERLILAGYIALRDTLMLLRAEQTLCAKLENTLGNASITIDSESSGPTYASVTVSSAENCPGIVPDTTLFSNQPDVSFQQTSSNIPIQPANTISIVSEDEIDALLTLCGALWSHEQLSPPTLSLQRICHSIMDGSNRRLRYMTHCLVTSLLKRLNNGKTVGDDVSKDEQQRDEYGLQMYEEESTNWQCMNEDVLKALERVFGCYCELLLVSDVYKLSHHLAVIENSPLKHKLIQLVVNYYLRTPSLTASLIGFGLDLRQSDWSACIASIEAKLTPAQLADDNGRNQTITKMIPLVVQSVPAWISHCVTDCQISEGKCQIQCQLVTLIQSRVDLKQVNGSGSSSHLEACFLSALSSCDSANAETRLCRLLVASVKCGALYASILKRLTSQKQACLVPVCLQLIQLIVTDTACVQLLTRNTSTDDDLPVLLAEYCIIGLDRTLDLHRDCEFGVGSRQMALVCINQLGQKFADALCCERVRSLLSRCHPLTQLYGKSILLSDHLPISTTTAAADDTAEVQANSCVEWQLLACLVTPQPELVAPWPLHVHTLLTATLASFLPYLCESEWSRIHSALMYHGSPRLSATPSNLLNFSASSSGDCASRLSTVCWYYVDLLCLWIIQPDRPGPAHSGIDSAPTHDGSAPSAIDSTSNHVNSSHSGDSSADVESLCLNSSDLLHCVNCLCQQITRSLADNRQRAADWRVNQLSALLMPLTHGLVLLNDSKHKQYQPTAASSASQPLEQLVLFVCTEFIKQITAMMTNKDTDSNTTNVTVTSSTTTTSAGKGATSSRGASTADSLFASVDSMDECSHVLSQFVVALFNIPNICAIKRQIVQHVSGSILAHVVQNAPQIV